MAVEIERKFLPRDESWRDAVRRSVAMVQGYLGGHRCSVRVRIEGERAFLNVKSRGRGMRRSEYEFGVPLDEARAMLDEFCPERVEKLRHEVSHGGHVFEVDEFLGANAGLVVAELELDHEDEAFERPAWLGREVTDEARYYNIALAREPYSHWAEGAGKAC
ncbi:MAG TPA: CYTH domain-containing protein [Candidatus Saccharimonadia bacterium]|nr:CYTH domain-containing protein [Candidatus Saccharimonadia bacterium]